MTRLDITESHIWTEKDIVTYGLYVHNKYMIITTTQQGKEAIDTILNYGYILHQSHLTELVALNPKKYSLIEGDKAYLGFLCIKHNKNVKIPVIPLPKENFNLLKRWYRKELKLIVDRQHVVAISLKKEIEITLCKQLISEVKPRIGKLPDRSSLRDYPMREEREYYAQKAFVNWLDGIQNKLIGLKNDDILLKLKPKRNIAAKYYALYHWILIELNIENCFERNINDRYVKEEIELFAAQYYPSTSKQGFYRSFIGLDITDKKGIANSFGKGFKEIIITISQNNPDVITYLDQFP